MNSGAKPFLAAPPGVSEMMSAGLRLVILIAFVPSLAAASPSAVCPLGASEAGHAVSADVSATGSPFFDFFTGGGSYMPRTHCLRTPAGTIDWPWIYGLLVLTGGVILAYLRIFGFWMKSYFGEERRDRNPKLLDLSGIFLWCAICGYAFSIIMFFWPAYRLLAFALVILNVFSWRFVWNLEPFRLAFAANRLQRELNESLRAKADELELLVAERTREAEAARAVADSANHAKSEFLANMSHEIRTPLTAVLGYADILVDAELPDEHTREAAQTISRNGSHLLSIINDILDLSKIEAGQMTISPVGTPTMQPIDEVMTLMRAKASAKGLLLLCEPEHGLPERIITDPTRFRQILSNLIGNAIKFTDRGTVSVRIGHTAQGAAGRLIVRIADTGVGIAPERQDRLFQPFSQADLTTSRRYGGTGLGLTISRKLARMLGGDVTFTSEPDRGSTFTLEIDTNPVLAPVAQSPAPMVSAGPAESLATFGSVRPPMNTTAFDDAPDPTKSNPLAGSRILLVDDGPDNRRLFSYHLQRAGALVQTAENGALGLAAVERAAAEAQPFDLVLMDMQMPEMDGYQATQTLRSSGYAGLVVALTANAMVSERARCLDAGCDEYLTKPIPRVQLVAACARLISRQGAGRSA